MERDERGQVHRREDVAVEHDERRAPVVARRESNGAAGTERLRLDAVVEAHAEGRPVAEDVLDAVGLVVEAEDNFVDLGNLPEHVDLILEKRPIEDGNDGLRRVQCQRPKPRSLPTGKENGSHDEGRS